VKLKKGVVQ